MTPRRLILMRIGSEADAAEVRRFHTSFGEAIPGVECAVAAAPARSRDGVPGFTHLSLFEFADVPSRVAYDQHPLHTGARDHVRSYTTEVVVIDLG